MDNLVQKLYLFSAFLTNGSATAAYFCVESVQNISKYKVFGFLAGVLACLTVLSYAIPDEGFKVFGLQFDFLPKSEIWQAKVHQDKDITDIVEQVDTTLIEIDTTEVVPEEPEFVPGKINYEINNATTVKFNQAGLSQLHIFFQQLNEAATKKEKTRILHFGDSQIEGDRMTAFIRQRIQQQFGGMGVGLIPAKNVYNTNSFKQTLSENFNRFTCFGGEKLSSQQYGLLNTAARFTPETIDSADQTVKTAWIELEPSKNTYANAREFRQLKMFYNSCEVPCLVKIFQGEQLLRTDSLIRDSLPHTLTLNFEATPQKIRYEFSAVKSPNITGFSMEGKSGGVQVDNIAMRGSSGTFLNKVDKQLFASQLKQLNVDLVIWQFGGNSMPYLEDSTQVENYARYYQSQLKTLKRLKPDLAIIVIGPSDMSTLINGYYETYPLLPYTVQKLKESAMAAGAGYWDLFEAMGGVNSMPAWVEKGLAGSDYIHFSVKGAKIASQLFYDAFIAEYAKYMK